MRQAGRFLFLIFSFPQKTDEATFLIFISSKTNEAPFLIILSINLLIFWFWHRNKINEASFLVKSEKKQMRGFETDEGGHEKQFLFDLKHSIYI